MFLTTSSQYAIIHLTKLLNERRHSLKLQKILKAISDPTRREILNLLKKGRLSAGDICTKFNISGAAISRHLSILKDAELVRDTHEGKYIYYNLSASVLEEMMLWMSDFCKKQDNGGENNEIE